MLISPDEINKSLSTKDWKYSDKKITKTYQFDTYMQGIEFINKIAKLAEAHNHHPDIPRPRPCGCISRCQRAWGTVYAPWPSSQQGLRPRPSRRWFPRSQYGRESRTKT